MKEQRRDRVRSKRKGALRRSVSVNLAELRRVFKMKDFIGIRKGGGSRLGV